MRGSGSGICFFDLCWIIVACDGWAFEGTRSIGRSGKKALFSWDGMKKSICRGKREEDSIALFRRHRAWLRWQNWGVHTVYSENALFVHYIVYGTAIMTRRRIIMGCLYYKKGCCKCEFPQGHEIEYMLVIYMAYHTRCFITGVIKHYKSLNVRKSFLIGSSDF